MTDDKDRLSRIENKLDQFDSKLDRLTEIVAVQAQHDERITQLAIREQRNEERLDELEKNVYRNSFITAIAQWTAAAVIGGLIVWIFKQIQ
ncbi:hypothetical protein [Endozoicomonas sp. Mp262]|uniref:hypothetical protein n=1 Tax=Endozoicomonas sp. Mp262 TaxID=2919499 RepID=UPI0021DB21A9